MIKTGSTILVLLALLAGCSNVPTFRSRGYEVITTDASGGQINEAMRMTYVAMGDQVQNPDGSKTNTSLQQWGKSWKDKQGKIEAARRGAEFDSKDGVHYVIEDIWIPGQPTVILLSSDNKKATMQLHNEFVGCLREAGVKPKNK
jgi:hypothetical protein